MRLVTAEQMRAIDARGVARVGDVALMRAAGKRIAECILSFEPPVRRVVAFAGAGNNGGDAFAAFAELDRSIERVVYARESTAPSAARADAQARSVAAGTVVHPFPENAIVAAAALADADLALDAMLGTGSRSKPDATFTYAIAALNAGGVPVLALDIPTGVDATTGAVSSDCVHATVTIAIGAVKLGLVLDPARDVVGTLTIGDIGLADEIAAEPGDRFEMLDDREFLALLPARGTDVDKRGAGAVLVIAGSAQFPGAAVLCSLGAARAGAGYVTLATPTDATATIRTHLIEQVVLSFDDTKPKRAIAELLDLVNHAGAVAIGPGFGLGEKNGRIVRGVIENLAIPFVADASALYHLSKQTELLRGKTCVITPHAGEFARLSGEGTIAPGTRIERLRSFVARTGITTLLKGPATLIDDGTTIHVNPTGTPTLATAGTGDVLSGIIATLLSQGLSPVDAARAGAYWHGLAAQIAHRTRPAGVIAGDVAGALGASLIRR